MLLQRSLRGEALAVGACIPQSCEAFLGAAVTTFRGEYCRLAVLFLFTAFFVVRGLIPRPLPGFVLVALQSTPLRYC